MTDATLKEVADFIVPKGPDGKRSEPLSKFNAEWSALSPEEKMQIRAGIGNGSYTY